MLLLFSTPPNASKEILKNQTIIKSMILRTRQLILESISNIWPSDVQVYKVSTAEQFASFALTGITPTLSAIGVFLVKFKADQDVVDIHSTVISLAKKLAVYNNAIKNAKANNFEGIKLSDFRNDVLAMLALTIRAEQKLIDANFQVPDTMDSVLRGIRNAASAVGAFVVKAAAKVAKPFIFVWDTFKIATYAALGLGALYVYKKHIGPK